MNSELTAVVVSLSGGALLANLFSVVLLIGETLRRPIDDRQGCERRVR